MRASSFETRNERTVPGTSVKKQKQREINQRRKETRILLSLESKRKVYERRRSFCHDKVDVDNLRSLLVLLQNRRRTTVRQSHRKESRPEPSVHLEEDRAMITFV